MKIISDYKELSGKVFENMAECEAAETEIDKQRKEAQDKEKEKSKLRKKLSDEVNNAEISVKKAYEDYEAAKERARVILEESNKEVSKIIEDAYKAVKDAEAAKKNAIVKYNNECGPYQKVYTGEKAKQEFDRVLSSFGSIFDFLNPFKLF